MHDVEDITVYFRSLKRGFDKDQFQDRVKLLGNIVDTFGLDYGDFHNLFKVWLNLGIPVTKWITVGACLVPQDKIERKTVEYTLRWILSNYQNKINFTRIAFVLDWLTAAMDNNCIDTVALDMGYEVYYKLLTAYEILTPHAMKLVYMLTKPGDVTRKRVVDLSDIAKIRESNRSQCRQIQVLLGLFKSYKPECVPETVPAFAVHTIFRKINSKLLARFNRTKGQRNITDDEKMCLNWVDVNAKRSKKVEPLIPNLEFLNIGSKQYNDKSTKNYLSFTEAGALLQYSVRHEMSRPSRWRALLGNEAGITLLATADHQMHAFLSHDLQHLLEDCFLSASPYSDEEKSDILLALARLQCCLSQGVPVVTRFLAHYLPLWDEKRHFRELLALVSWVCVLSPAHVSFILRPLERFCARADPLKQCAILHAILNLYDNMAYSSTRSQQHFLGGEPSPHYSQFLTTLVPFIAEITNKIMQVNPDDIRVLHMTVECWSRLAKAPVPSLSSPPPLAVALPLLTATPALLDRLADLMLVYKKIASKEKKTNSRKVEDELWTLQAYTIDMLTCLWTGKALTQLSNGVIFTKVPPEFIQSLCKTIPNADESLTLRSNIMFSTPDTWDMDKDMSDQLWFDKIVSSKYKNIAKFLRKLVPQLKV